MPLLLLRLPFRHYFIYFDTPLITLDDDAVDAAAT